MTDRKVIAVVGAAFFVNSSKKDDDKPATTTPGPAANALTLTVVVSPEKEALLKPLVREFNAAQTGANDRGN